MVFSTVAVTVRTGDLGEPAVSVAPEELASDSFVQPWMLSTDVCVLCACRWNTARLHL